MSEEQDPLLAALGGEDNSNDNNATAAVPEEEPPRIDPEQEARNKASFGTIQEEAIGTQTLRRSIETTSPKYTKFGEII